MSEHEGGEEFRFQEALRALAPKYFTDFLFIPPKKILFWGIIASAKYLENWIFLYVSVLL